MGTEYQLKEGDELDAICHRHYGELPGALEAVLRANRLFLHLFDDHGRVGKLSKPAAIILPELKRPTTVTNSIRVFE
jgi:phage tail protein X